VFEALVDRQDDHLAGAAQFPFHQHPAQVGLHAGVLTLVIGKDLLDGPGRAHDDFPLQNAGLRPRLRRLEIQCNSVGANGRSLSVI
jgi:hypothetical protein